MSFVKSLTAKSINCTARSDISVATNVNVSTTNGILAMDADSDVSSGGVTALAANVYLTAVGGKLIMHDRLRGHITVATPGYWRSTTDVELSAGVMVTGSGEFSIKADFDMDGTSGGTFTCESTGNITAQSSTLAIIFISAGNVALSAGCTIDGGSNMVQIAPSTLTGAISLGSASGGVDLSNAELDLLTSTGTVYIGGVHTSTITANAMAHTTTIGLLHLNAQTSITFNGAASTRRQQKSGGKKTDISGQM